VSLEDGDTSPAPVKNSKAKSATPAAAPGATEVSIKTSQQQQQTQQQSRFNNHHISSLHKNHGPAVPANNTNGNQVKFIPHSSGHTLATCLSSSRQTTYPTAVYNQI
jgi:hypothetical protein